jgi:hypothetical protein
MNIGNENIIQEREKDAGPQCSVEAHAGKLRCGLPRIVGSVCVCVLSRALVNCSRVRQIFTPMRTPSFHLTQV